MVWGQVPDGEPCSTVHKIEQGVVVDKPTPVPFTACDNEGWPVAHSLPSASDSRRFTAFLGNTEAIEQLVTYFGDGMYEVIVEADRHGPDVLHINLDGDAANHMEPLAMVASCPSTGKAFALAHGEL